MKTIQLTKGMQTIVDDEDFERFGYMRWQAFDCDGGPYARRDTLLSDGPRRKILLHREIMGAKHGVLVDHINRNPLDNRRSNLRLATALGNARNRRGNAGSTSQFKGVCKPTNGRRFVASIRILGRSYHIGSFDTQEAAARAYDERALIEFGEFAYINFPDSRDEAA